MISQIYSSIREGSSFVELGKDMGEVVKTESDKAKEKIKDEMHTLEGRFVGGCWTKAHRMRYQELKRIIGEMG